MEICKMKKLVLLTLDERNAIDALTQEEQKEETNAEKLFNSILELF